MSQHILKVENLSHRYSVQWAIRNISFDIREKGVMGLLGSNGAGKSTMMNIICGVLTQTEGEVYINDISLKKYPVEAKKYIGFLPQQPPLYPDLSVREYLRLSAQLRLMPKQLIDKAVRIAEERCEIAHFSRRLIRNLSGGYQQRVGIAQAIIHNPALVILDEPTNGLDPLQIIEIRNLIKEIARDHTVLLSTHILQEVEASCNYIKMIEHGRVVFSGNIEEFDQVITPTSFTVTMDLPPAEEELNKLSGITRVETLNPNQYRLHFSTPGNHTEKFVGLSIEKGWELREINLERESLDTIFAQLSKKSN